VAEANDEGGSTMSNRLLDMLRHGRGVIREERGVASLEYAALLGFVLLGIAATVTALGQNVGGKTASISKDLAGDAGIVYVETNGAGAHHN